MSFSVVDTLEAEIRANPPPINGSVNQLIQGFTKYLKEPRFQSPLTIKELSRLFQNFYRDLNSTVLTTYTQSNSTKKSLISKTNFFKEHPADFDYLLAIANYSSSSIKLVKRTDPQAVLQLRIFNYYKFLVVWDIIERAQIAFFEGSNKDDELSLYHKLFKYDEKDIVCQQFFDKKLAALKSHQLKFDCFVEENDAPKELLQFINSDDFDDAVADIVAKFAKIKHTVTPLSKLRIITQFQKDIIALLSVHCNMKPHSINNDILLPVLIYLIIYKIAPHSDLLLNFNFIKSFVNFVDPYDVSILNSTSFFFYNPTETSRASGTKSVSRKTTIFDCLNLNEATEPASHPVDFKFDFFATDKELVSYLNSTYLNNSELQYYLTNFEAVLFFIQNVTMEELSQAVDTTEDVLTMPLSVLIEQHLAPKYEFPKLDDTKKDDVKKEDVEAADNRSRSSSLFNNLTNKITDAKNRSRSNSNLLRNTRESFPTIDTSELNSSMTSPLHSPSGTQENPFDTSTSFGMMKNILGRFSSVSVSHFRAPEEEEGLLPQIKSKHARSSSIIDRLSPNNTRTRSSSLEQGNGNGTASPTRKNTIASKLSIGVTDLMTKLNTPVTSGDGVSALGENTNPSNVSEMSLKSLDQQEQEQKDAKEVKRPDNLRTRTASMQIMEKWFTNMSFNSSQQGTTTSSNTGTANTNTSGTEGVKGDIHLNDAISESREGSVFSTPSKELARYHNMDFDSLTVSDLRTLKVYYDQLCNELGVGKFESKSTTDELNDQMSSINSI